MFDIRENEIWYCGRIFAIIVAHGHASLGWSSEARDILINNDSDLVQVATIARLIGNTRDDFKPATDWPSSKHDEFTSLLDLPEGLDYTETEVKAAETLSWYIRPEMRLLFNTVLRAHIRREREEFQAALQSLWNNIESELTE
jgi:hypothetical protein